MADGSFSVWLWGEEDWHYALLRGGTAEQAMAAAWLVTQRRDVPYRVTVVDDADDVTVFEWVAGRGVTWLPVE